ANIFLYMYIDTQIWMIFVYIGTISCAFFKLIYDSIFGLQRYKLRVIELLGKHCSIYYKSLMKSKEIRPIYTLYAFVKTLIIVNLKLLDRFENFQSCSQCQIGFVHKSFISIEANHSRTFFYALG